jgi:hypothetical protein
MMRALRGPSLRCVVGIREGEDLLAECVFVGICLHLSCGQQSVILWKMRGRRDLTSKASPEVPIATKRMCIVDRT